MPEAQVIEWIRQKYQYVFTAFDRLPSAETSGNPGFLGSRKRF